MNSKRTLQDLALFGGGPAFDEQLFVGRPNIGNREKLFERINDLLDRRWLTNNGPYVQEFEKRLADYAGVKHCIAACNATIALELVIRALGFKGEVIVPSFTFIATAHALQWQEITPVFCDIDPRTHCIDPEKIEALITPRTSGIIGVHLWGRLCDVDRLLAIGEKHRLPVLFDAAHAFGCTSNGKMAGGFGAAEVFSFHATKFFNSLEGGAISTNDDALAEKIHLMKNFGFSGYDNVIHIGTNGKMNEISAAMGLTGLESLEEFISVNRENYEVYRRELADLPFVTLREHPADEKSNHQYIVLEVEENSPVSRDLLIRILWAENVIARRYFYPGCHRMEPYRSHFPNARLLLPETERIARRVLILPTGTAVGEEAIAKICGLLRFSIEHGAEITCAAQ